MKTATTTDEQINLLLGRGMRIDDKAKAKKALSDIGYYRLGFYWYPFEENVEGERAASSAGGSAAGVIMRNFYAQT